MVVDAAFLAGTIASLAMNGACCMYQITREEELMEELREEMQREWDQQRKREKRKQHVAMTAEEQRREIVEDQGQQYQEQRKEINRLLQGKDQLHDEYKFFARTSPPRSRAVDPPTAAAQLLISRCSSILDDDDDDKEEETTIFDAQLLRVEADEDVDTTMESPFFMVNKSSSSDDESMEDVPIP